jgi:FeS assembly SUF system protein
MPTQDEVIGAIKQVFDPEIPVNIHDLGLIYKIDIQDKNISIQMSLTSQSCPSAQQIPQMIKDRVKTLPGVADVSVEVVWEPQWNPSMITPEGKKILKLEE